MRRQGQHRHVFFNPRGILFLIRCFGNAPGCLSLGSVTAEFSWFAGYQWCYAHCVGCGQHLGWHYQGPGGDHFFGLIVNRLTTGQGSSDPPAQGEPP